MNGLHDYLDRRWRWTLEEFPELAIQTGEARPERAWTDLSLEGVERRHQAERVFLAELDGISRDELNDQDRLNYDLARREAESAVEAQRYPSHLLALDQLMGIHQRIAISMGEMPDDPDWREVRLAAVDDLIHQAIDLLREGLARGITQPRVVLGDLDRQLVDLAPLSLAFLELRRFVADEYLPGCRESIATADLPDGEEWYRFRVREETTTDLSPDEIHQMGLEELPRIHAAMEGVMAVIEWPGDRSSFLAHLRSEPQYFFSSGDEMVTAYRALCKRLDPTLARLFGVLPRLPYGVDRMPDYMDRSGPAAYYMPGSPKAGRPGTFSVNTFDLRARPRWGMVALAMHEAAPGHHLQFAIAQELSDVPAFRRHAAYGAYVEGWALYAESLGHEIGLYEEDPYARFGALVFDAWRSARLVIDTGIHSRGWTRDQAIEFMLANTGITRHDAVSEIDRYIVWPGQALCYKIGQRQILDLRRRAEQAEGTAFDLRRFHDRILGQGPLPLDILADQFT